LSRHDAGRGLPVVKLEIELELKLGLQTGPSLDPNETGAHLIQSKHLPLEFELRTLVKDSGTGALEWILDLARLDLGVDTD
jgi:hypothetical protein